MSRKPKNVFEVRIYERDTLKYVCGNEHDAFMYLLRVQPRSVLAAITEEGWSVEVEDGEGVTIWNEKYYGL
jgi:hypothetical protein